MLLALYTTEVYIIVYIYSIIYVYIYLVYWC
jgi:hypothetical protein